MASMRPLSSLTLLSIFFQTGQGRHRLGGFRVIGCGYKATSNLGFRFESFVLRRLRLCLIGLAGRILHQVGIPHPFYALGKQSLLSDNGSHILRRPFASALFVPSQQSIARALTQAVSSARTIDHLCQALAILFSGKVCGRETFRVVGLKSGEVLTNEAQVSRT